MNKDLHDIDDLFRSALDSYQEAPSSGIKKSIEAALDKKDGESLRKRLIGWKRTAFLLLILVAGFVLYESGFMKIGSGRPGDEPDKKQENYSYDSHQKESSPNSSFIDNTFNNNRLSNDREALPSQINNNDKTDSDLLMHPGQNGVTIISKEISDYKSLLENNTPGKKIILENESSNTFAIVQNNEASEPESILSKYPKGDYKPRGFLSKSKMDWIPSFQQINTSKTLAGLTGNQKHLWSINDTLSKINRPKNTKNKDQYYFKAFWWLTAFASYERAGYRLDSDLPNSITSIKHDEVHEPSFTIGLLATRQLKKQWGLQTGFIFSQTEIGISPKKLYALQDPAGSIAFKYITSTGYAYIKPGLGAPPAIGDSLITTEGKHMLKSLSVPLIIKYSINKNKLTVVPGAGIEASFLTSAKVETEFESPANPEIIFINKLDGARPFYLSIVADAELRYQLNNRVSLSFRPGMKIAISPITKNNIVETFPRSMGAGLGLTYKF